MLLWSTGGNIAWSSVNIFEQFKVIEGSCIIYVICVCLRIVVCFCFVWLRPVSCIPNVVSFFEFIIFSLSLQCSLTFIGKFLLWGKIFLNPRFDLYFFGLVFRSVCYLLYNSFMFCLSYLHWFWVYLCDHNVDTILSIHFLLVNTKLHIWSNGQWAFHRWVRAQDHQIGICNISDKHTVLWSKSKYYLTRYQVNFSEWIDNSTSRLLLR